MKVIAFHTNELNERGTNVAVYDYAHYNETILGNKSYIISNAKNELSSLQKFENRFKVFLYHNFVDCEKFCTDNNIEYVYYIKAGDNDGKFIPGTKTLVHAVFQHKEMHGDVYTYISEWLAAEMGMPGNYVPHIVDMPQPKHCYRKKLGIPDEAIVLGRYGGQTEFDLPFTYSAIDRVLKERDDIYFLFMNTQQFLPKHKNIIHVQGTYNMQHKSDFINTCDYMLHGRNLGESFGLAIGEFLFHDKPVILWDGGNDKHHITMLREKGIWYLDGQSLYEILKNIEKPKQQPNYYRSVVAKFAPDVVMTQFNKIFLN